MTVDEGEAIGQFRDAMARAGLDPPSNIEPDGRLHRFASHGRPNDDAGWYALHGDAIPAGAFGDWRSGISRTWRADIGRTLSREEEAAHRKRLAAIRRAREAEEAQRQADAATLAAVLWRQGTAAPERHPYLAAKGISAHGLRVHDGALMVPVREGGALRSLQFIDVEGGKRFLAGGRVRGGYFAIGAPDETLCIVEGFATGASVHEATGHAVAVAFNAGNLAAVATALRDRHPDLRLVICADDDAGTAGNPGLAKAREAAAAAGAALAVPDFGVDRPAQATDFNDLARHAGPDAVRAAIQAALAGGMVTSDARDDWPEPGPIVSELKPVPAFDAQALLPDSLRAWIVDEAERMPCPPEFVAAAALVALGSIVGARCAIKPKRRDSWLVVPNLWGGIVGDPSAKKSPAWGAALRPLDRLVACALEAHREELAEYETQRLVHDVQKDVIEKRIAKAATKGDDPATIARELRQHADQAPLQPLPRRFKSNDTTVEKLGELLRDNPAGLLVIRDELVGLIASWEREGREGDRAFFLEAWNGNQAFDTDRIGRGHIAIPNLCVSIFGGIQPDKLTIYLKQATGGLGNDGMLQRFQMLVFPDARQWEWRDRTPDGPAWQRAGAVFDALAAFDPVAWGAMPVDETAKFPHFPFGEEAQELFIAWSEELHRDRMPAEEESIVRQHLAKYDKLFPALALILHLADSAEAGHAGPVGHDAALRAAAWCEFLEAHARRCYGLLKDDGLRAAQALAAKLAAGKLMDGFTVRDVRRHQWRDLKTDSDIEPGLRWLEDEDWLRSEPSGGDGPGSGRRTMRYRVNPKVLRPGTGRQP